MTDVQLELLIDLHLRANRQGPGGEAETRRALERSAIDRSHPMRARFPKFLEDHSHGNAALEIVQAEEKEISLYEKYSDYFGYGV